MAVANAQREVGEIAYCCENADKIDILLKYQSGIISGGGAHVNDFLRKKIMDSNSADKPSP